MKMPAVLAVMSIGLIQPQPAFERGENVHVFKADGTAAEPAVQRIIAVGGDRLRIEQAGVFVNDQAVTGISAFLFAVLPRESEVIPAGHVFVVGEERDGRVIGRTWSIIPTGRLSR